MEMGVKSIEPSSEDLQEWHTDFDDWICKFEARLVSRSSKTESSIEELKADFTARINVEKRKQPPSSLSLQEIFVDGVIVAQKRRQKALENCFNFFKKNDDFTHYDYVILTLVNENGRKNLYKYVRSKI